MKATWHGAVLARATRRSSSKATTTFRRESIRREHFRESETHTVCPWKGLASYYDLVVGDAVNRDAAWYYPAPNETAKEIAGYVAFWKGVKVES